MFRFMTSFASVSCWFSCSSPSVRRLKSGASVRISPTAGHRFLCQSPQAVSRVAQPPFAHLPSLVSFASAPPTGRRQGAAAVLPDIQDCTSLVRAALST
jgi:hypothetical protein